MSSASRILRLTCLLPAGLFSGLLAGLLAGCAVLPDWTYRQSREVSVLVDYEVDPDEGFVVLPASNSWLKVLHLRTRPGVVQESFLDGERRMHVPPDTRRLRVLCRYKLYGQHDNRGRLLPWPTAEQLLRHLMLQF